MIAHLGMPQYEEFLELAETTPSLHLDTAMMPTDPVYADERYPTELRDRLRAIADQLVFGSDFPTIPVPYAAAVRGLAMLELDDDGLRGVLHDRAVGLIDRVGT